MMTSPAAIILAGGKESRLGALTDHRVKPALPMGGSYRLIDVALSNLVHSRVRDI
ncbi:sugar phosphate nucleotidyltransferase [Bowdeniella nasicola]|uniref:sugar phosphate nucleotidyltransferase n=1 Tax=Bowdeniella nasicola TaxID=208480 RepID=UPI001C9E2B72|nr:sugar phosphate nucleotidyltransferase [Bowdeniella nasicola]